MEKTIFCPSTAGPQTWASSFSGLLLLKSSVLTRVGETYQTKRCFQFAYLLKWVWTWFIGRLTLKSPRSSSQMDVCCYMCVCRAQKGENEGKILGKQWSPRTEKKLRVYFLKSLAGSKRSTLQKLGCLLKALH